jgi:hypothetical protein
VACSHRSFFLLAVILSSSAMSNSFGERPVKVEDEVSETELHDGEAKRYAGADPPSGTRAGDAAPLRTGEARRCEAGRGRSGGGFVVAVAVGVACARPLLRSPAWRARPRRDGGWEGIRVIGPAAHHIGRRWPAHRSIGDTVTYDAEELEARCRTTAGG